MPTVFNTDTPKPAYVYDSALDTWFPLAGIAPSSSVDRFYFTATSGQTSISGVDNNGSTLAYEAATEQVYLNGVLLARTDDYTGTNGTSITAFSPALSTGDIVEVITFNPSLIEKTNAILTTAINAKGDLIAGTADNSPGILTVGVNGYVLSANSAIATGLEWIANDQGDLTAVSSGTGITVTSGTGPIPSIAVDDTLVATTSNTMTLSNKTLTSPVITLALNAQAVTSYTSVLADSSKLVTMNLATANTFLVPTNASVAYPVGTTINISQIGVGQTKIISATTSTTTINSTGAASGAPLLRAKFSAASCIKTATDVWLVVGDIE